MKDIVRQNILKVKPYTPGRPIEEVERELGLKGVIKLASNENCFGPSPKAMAGAAKAIREMNRYPDATGFYLKRKLANVLGVKEENILLGNGSDEVICLAVRTFVNAGDEVVIARPTFLIYEIAAELQAARITTVPMTDDLRYDLKAMKAAITDRTKLVFIANPDNPTGTYVSKKDLEEFLRNLPKNLIVFLDEAYFEFASYSRRDYPDGLQYLGAANVIVGRSFSKAYGLAGLRIGYGIAGAEIIGFMERVREPFNVNIIAQAAALAALDDKPFLRKTLSHVEKEKGFLYSQFRKLGLRCIESATNFILVDIGQDCKKAFLGLLKEGVIVRDMKAWGLDTFIRVTIGTRAENMKFLKALRKIVD